MLEGLIQAYFDAFERAWVPRCEPDPRVRDSQTQRTALSSPQTDEGETRYVETHHMGQRRGARPHRLREC